MIKKRISMINNDVADIIHTFSVQRKVKLMGSNSYRGLLYPSDYDIVSKITEPAEVLAKHFQDLFSKKLPFIFMDFKSGVDKIRWTPKDLAKGFKGISLAESFKQDGMIKLDFAVPVGNTFCEVSEIYETKYQSKKSKKRIEDELEEDITGYAKDNSMKALKRYYSLMVLQKKDKKKQKRLVDFFNSDVGLVNKVANDLELLVSIRSKISKEAFYKNVQMLKEMVSRVAWVDRISLLDQGKIEEMVKQLRSQLNPLCKAMLQSLG